MKHVLPILFGLIMIMAIQAPDNKTVILDQFNRAQGEWDGFLEFTDFNDTKIKSSIPAKCTTAFDGKVWSYEVQYDEGNGEIGGGGGELTVNPDGTKIDNNGIYWNVTEVVASGDSVRIRMETLGKDNRKKATLRRTLDVTSTTFSLLEEVKYQNTEVFFERNKHLFRKKKSK
jgi:hypothetical protein